MSSILGFSF